MKKRELTHGRKATGWKLFILAVVLCLLSACGTAPQETEKETAASERALSDFKEPPALVVANGENRVDAVVGTYSWSRETQKGTFEDIEADALHPLEMLPYLKPLKVGEDGTVELQFELKPAVTEVRYWPEEYAGEEDGEGHFDDATALTVEDGRVTVPTDGGYICEVWAKWNDAGGNGGSARYVFWTQKQE